MRKFFGDGFGVHRQSVVVENAAQLGHLVGGKIELEQAGQLRVAVLLDHINALMRGHKVVNLVSEGKGPDAQIIRVLPVAASIWSRLSVRAQSVEPKARKPIFEAPFLTMTGAGTSLRIVSNLQRQPVHHRLVLLRVLGVFGRIVVSRAASKVGGLGVARSGQRAPADGVAVHVAIARKAAQPVQVGGGEHLAAIQGLGGIIEWLGHPVVHAQIEIGEHKDRGLHALCQVEGRLGQLEALLDRTGQQNQVLGIAVGEEGRRKQIGLLGARGHTRRRPAALHDDDDAGNLGVVAQAAELGHQRHAGAGGRGHGARARPACAQHHADGGQLVLGLHHGKGRLAFRRHAQLLEQVGGRLDHRGGGRNGVPGDHRHAGKDRAHAAGRVAVDDDLARGFVHPLDEERVPLGQILLGIVEAGFDGAEVQIEDLLLLGELPAQAALHHAQIDGQQLGDDAHVDHVLDQLAQLGLGADGGRDLVEGNGIEEHVAARTGSSLRFSS